MNNLAAWRQSMTVTDLDDWCRSEAVLPFLSRHAGVFQHDNARSQAAHVCRDFLNSNHVDVRSPDLFQTEHLQDVLGRRIRQRRLPHKLYMRTSSGSSRRMTGQPTEKQFATLLHLWLSISSSYYCPWKACTLLLPMVTVFDFMWRGLLHFRDHVSPLASTTKPSWYYYWIL